MTDDLQHYGVLGMHWGQSSGGDSGAASANRIAASKEAGSLADKLSAIRKERSTGTKVGDWLLKTGSSDKMNSEKNSNSAVAKRGAEVYGQLEKIRKQRTTGQKIVDVLMTPAWSTRKFSEMTPSKKRKTIAIVAGLSVLSMGVAALA
jgi:hypothetical protein